MKNNNSGKKISFFIWEFLMVFLGVALAFWINDWGERRRDEAFARSIIRNITEDIRKDSAGVASAIKVVEGQYASLANLIKYLGSNKTDSTNKYILSCYGSYNAFNPTTGSYQSMIYGGDLKLLKDYNLIKILRDIDQANQQLFEVHRLYYKAIEGIRNNFICKQPNIHHVNFIRLQEKVEFWNRVNFLKDNYLKNYKIILLNAQAKYNEFLSLTTQNY